ncbi:hydantoinase/oxoprolinase family protein [Alphaproteobacteria bacterium]|nr:hydantoinase/oxoprolinase family protein [Alphaproteobacteria bacterium]
MSDNFFVGVDIGGTFTDVFISDGKEYWEGKSSTTPGKLHEGLLSALETAAKELSLNKQELLNKTNILTHGSTIITNILAEMKGAKTGFITTKGFKDLLNIGRSPRTNDMDYFAQKNRPEIVTRDCIAEVSERVDFAGKELVPLDQEEVKKHIKNLVEEKKCEAIAVCFLFSFKNNEHEKKVKEIINNLYPDVYVSVSCEVNPVFREYERMITTILNSYSGRGFAEYMGVLEDKLKNENFKGRLLITQSNGGSLSAGEARLKPVTLAVSGPAGGIVSSSYLGKTINEKNLLTADMGGTSFDVSVIFKEEPIQVSRAQIGAFNTNLPILDITAIGAGGGSIAWIDNRGMLRVGPHSAGANPGPSCYNRGGEEPTVTDAAVTLGFIDPNYFLGGEIKLNDEKAKKAIEKIANKMNLKLEEAAVGIYRTISANMGNALRNVTIEKGFDPREFALVSYGGCGPLFVANICKELQIKSILIPENSAVWSAFGACVSDVKRDIANTYYTALPTDIGALISAFKDIEAKAKKLVKEDGIKEEEIKIYYELDMRIHGQIWEISVGLGEIDIDTLSNEIIYENFKKEYGRKYGDALVGAIEQCDILNIRTLAVGIKPKPQMLETVKSAKKIESCFKGKREIFIPEISEWKEIDIIDGSKLENGMKFNGPKIIERKNTTVYCPPDTQIEIDKHLNCLMTIN